MIKYKHLEESAHAGRLAQRESPSRTATLNLHGKDLLIKIAQEADMAPASNFLLKEEGHAHHTAWSQLIHGSRGPDVPLIQTTNPHDWYVINLKRLRGISAPGVHKS